MSFAYILVVQFHRQFEMVIPTEDSVITEMTSTLRDWQELGGVENGDL